MTTTRANRPALDTVPELTRYHDGGCDLHPACLTCPLPSCRYDGAAGEVLKEPRNTALLAAFATEGLSALQLAARFKVSKRTVHRLLQKDRA